MTPVTTFYLVIAFSSVATLSAKSAALSALPAAVATTIATTSRCRHRRYSNTLAPMLAGRCDRSTCRPETAAAVLLQKPGSYRQCKGRTFTGSAFPRAGLSPAMLKGSLQHTGLPRAREPTRWLRAAHPPNRGCVAEPPRPQTLPTRPTKAAGGGGRQDLNSSAPCGSETSSPTMRT